VNAVPILAQGLGEGFPDEEQDMVVVGARCGSGRRKRRGRGSGRQLDPGRRTAATRPLGDGNGHETRARRERHVGGIW
jgi:hypothetical protein